MARTRNARGQFTKRSSGGGSTAIARRSGGAIVVRTETRPSKRRGGGRRRGAGGGGGAAVRKGAAIGGFILGYVKKNYAAQTIDKLPDIKGSHIATLGVGLHFLRPKSGGILDHVATAAVAIGAYELGQGLSGDDVNF